jgi:hypothetical protein
MMPGPSSGGASATGESRVHERLAEFFHGLRPRSKTSLEQALAIRETGGVPATLIVQIPADPAKPAEVFITTGPVQIVHDLRH